MFDGENIGGLSIYTEGNQGKTKKLANRTLVDQSSKFFTMWTIVDSFSKHWSVGLFCV